MIYVCVFTYLCTYVILTSTSISTYVPQHRQLASEYLDTYILKENLNK
jgi:hypothetical protein